VAHSRDPRRYVVEDAGGRRLAYVYAREGAGAGGDSLTRDGARRIAANIAKLPELLRKPNLAGHRYAGAIRSVRCSVTLLRQLAAKTASRAAERDRGTAHVTDRIGRTCWVEFMFGRHRLRGRGLRRARDLHCLHH
jgi:hypothetical protein